MRGDNKARTGGEILVDQLIAQGVAHVFCVPGESYLAALDALYEQAIELTVCRQEGGAAMMAEAHGKLTGRPGICFVTRGPGVTNSSSGIHIAHQDSTPMIVFVGQVQRDARERDAFQEIDYRAVFGSLAKWATEIDDIARIPEIVSRAFYTAMSGRPGPVVIALPEDMLTERGIVTNAPRCEPVEAWPGERDYRQLEALLAAAERPVMILGGSRWSETAHAQIAQFAERFAIPVTTTFRRQHLFDATHAAYAGDLGIGPNPKLLARVKDADLVIAVGTRLGEIPSQGYTLFEIPAPRQKLVHVFPSSEELGRVYSPTLAINASPSAFAAGLSKLNPKGVDKRREHLATAHADYVAWSEKPTPVPGDVNFGEIVVWLRDRLPPDAILCNGAGNFAGWVLRFARYRRFNTQLGSTSGSMGYGLPSAIGAKRLYPDRTVIAICGDGDFLMTGQEFATCVQYDLPIVTLLVDNGMYGTIRMHQEHDYPGRVIGTDLRNPDFAAYARAFGGFGVTVTRTADFEAAYLEASRSGKPAIVHIKVDPEAITPTMSIQAIREKAKAGGR